MTLAFKGMDENMQCQGFQYEIGKDYEIDGPVELCAKGFHACVGPLDVFSFYDPASSRFFEVEQNGNTQADEIKTVSSKIKIKAELTLHGLIKAGVEFILERAKSTKTNTGDSSAATNTGDSSAATNMGNRSAATNTGDRSAATNTGDSSAATNTGDSSAATNTGNRSAATNTGDSSAATNTGDSSAATNTGDSSAATNTGYSSAATNTGNRSAATNTGNRSAATNTGNRSAATNTGYRSAARVEGKQSIACALGISAKASAKEDGWIVVVDWRQDSDKNWFIYEIHHAKVGQKINETMIEADTWYWFENGELKSEKVEEKQN